MICLEILKTSIFHFLSLSLIFCLENMISYHRSLIRVGRGSFLSFLLRWLHRDRSRFSVGRTCWLSRWLRRGSRSSYICLGWFRLWNGHTIWRGNAFENVQLTVGLNLTFFSRIIANLVSSDFCREGIDKSKNWTSFPEKVYVRSNLFEKLNMFHVFFV